MDYKDYYAVLGVPRTASDKEIKKAFRKLAREHHPDVKGGDAAAERRFKEVNEANAVLSDPDKRALYDRLGNDWEAYARAGAGAGAGAGTGARAGAAGGGTRSVGPRDSAAPVAASAMSSTPPTTLAIQRLLQRLLRRRLRTRVEARAAVVVRPAALPSRTSWPGWDWVPTARRPRRRGGRGGRTATAAAPARLPTAEATAEVTLEEAYHGTSRLVDVEGKRLEVTIPRGADTGTRIRLTGKAPGGGDLYVVVRQRPDPTFKRRGADLERELPLTLEEALLGAQVKVRTPKGRVALTIPAGTQPGRVFRLTGQGMPRFRADGYGDLYAKAKVILPTDLSEPAREAAKKFFKLANQPEPTTRES